MTSPTDDPVEIAARAQCIFNGYDPDQILRALPSLAGTPRWKAYVPSVRAALAALGERFALVPRVCTEEMYQAADQCVMPDSTWATQINAAIAIGNVLPKREG